MKDPTHLPHLTSTDQTDNECEFYTVEARPACYDIEDLYEEDQESVGIFFIVLPRGLPPRIAAAAAMGAYHNTMPIKYLDSFEFTVYNEDGYEVEPDWDADWYELAKIHGAFVY